MIRPTAFAFSKIKTSSLPDWQPRNTNPSSSTKFSIDDSSIMRLIHTTTLAMETFYGRKKPYYAILSHTWEDEEVTLQDWNSWGRNRMKGFHKIRMTCQLAASQEAINSMYKWYQRAYVCFAYLSDFRLAASNAPRDAMFLGTYLRGCRWFHRGWTLQELIAPSSILFYQQNWEYVGNKTDWNGALSRVTGISPQAIDHYKPGDYSIAERMSWASKRETTREEDKAYCLLGIFDVNMPMLYGEGAKAFRRLQEVIIQTGYDVSIFVWTRPYTVTKPIWAGDGHQIYGAFAEGAEDFHLIPAELVRRQWNEVSVTNAGVKLTLDLCLVSMPGTGRMSYVLPISRSSLRPDGRSYLCAQGVELRMMSAGRFVREGLEKLVEIPIDGKTADGETKMVRWIRCPDVYILIASPHLMISGLLQDASYQHYFAFPPGCRVVKEWPSGSWNDAESKFMMSIGEPNYGSCLVETQSPMPADAGSARHCQTRVGEFMFLFSSLPADNSTSGKKSQQDLQCTIVGYREYQLMIDSINLRMGAGGMDVKEMRRTLRNYAIPRQRTAAVPVEGAEQYIYTSVSFDSESGFAFRSSLIALENEQQPWCV
ncbi:Vegetative incompatibility protein HET-E-1 [Colletotrichum fructicola Nara gc5]|uniref:Vegetative incompatibility protein HET-E-1 n=1 Tax=Colletotrichum fructicola (strain Nara gc5) TaxID=1213859 RepID=A0A7J6IVE0_COLFN|nr:Vegetative incompatibility protein HET-E-1 [Colletotrichum fructicola Nara gc5]